VLYVSIIILRFGYSIVTIVSSIAMRRM